MKTNILAGITTALIIGSIPSTVFAQQRIDCYKRGNTIQCPGYGNFTFRNSGNNTDQTQIESSVRNIYLQVLGRDADANGLRDFTEAVRSRRLSLTQVRIEIVNSPEADQSIRRAYQQGYGRNPNANQLRNAKIAIQNGSSLDQLSRQSSNSNNNNSGDQRTAITQIYQQVLGRDPDNGGLGYYSDAVQNGRITLIQFRRDLAYSPESDKNINKIYQEILGRDVDSNGLRNSRRILESNGGSLDQVQIQLSSANEARNRNGDRTFSLQDILGLFR
jgi:Domain of unknown function (DUF4214)